MIGLIVLLFSFNAGARPEYATLHRITTCRACHLSPVGGGPRDINGKLYGTRLAKADSWFEQDRFSFEGRMLSYYPANGPSSRQGTALMTASVFAHVPMTRTADGSQIHFVAGYSLGMLLQGAREIYGQWQSETNTVQVGRFNVPFGLLTDEHRTFTRLLTRSAIFDYELGAMISRETSDSTHVDFAVTNGLQSGGLLTQNNPAAPDATMAFFFNGRWMPRALPFLLGTSFGYHSRMEPHRSPYGVSLYSVLSLDRLSDHRFAGEILAEAVYAEGWNNPDINPNINRYFIPHANAAYLSAVRDSPAIAWSVQVNWGFRPQWLAQARLESLVFDPRYAGDRFQRTGLGLKHYWGGNLIVIARYEWADVGRADLKNPLLPADQDAFWAMLEFLL